MRQPLSPIWACLALMLAFAFASPAMAQRQAFSNGVVPQAYQIEVTPNAEAGTLTGTVSIELTTAAPTAAITLNAADMEITQARIDGRRAAVTADAAAQTATITTGRTLRAGAHVVELSYAGRIYDEAYGLFRVSYDTEGGPKRLLATQFEPGDARRFAPMFDQPNLRATFTLTVNAPENEAVISNMPAVERTVRNGVQRVRFQQSPAMPSYLLFLAVGDLERISTTTANGVDVGVVTVRGQSELGRFALESAVDVLRYFEGYFGLPYPLPKLDNIGVPGAGGFGAMENWGAILYFDQFLLLDPAISNELDRQNVFGIVAHEIAHQWFGNLVTMAWWDDLWLNEGFASWMADKATDALHPDWSPWLSAAQGRNRAMDLDSRAGTHPVVQTVNTIDQANLAFDTITYQKGQAVIRMIESYIGEDAFRAGVRAYIGEHLYGSAQTVALWRALEAASQTPITQIAREFTGQNGVPLVTVSAAPCAPGASSTRLRLTQVRFAADAASRTGESWTIPIVAQRVGQSQTARILLTPGGADLEVPGGCGPVKVNADQDGYYRTLYEGGALDGLVAQFSSLSASDQLGLLSDYWAFGKSGAAPMRAYLQLVSAIPPDADPYVIMQAAGGLQRLAELQRGREEAPAFEAFARMRLQPFFARVGWTERAGEAATDAVLRDVLIRTLGRLNDEAVVAQARRLAQASETDPAALPGAIREAALRAVGAQADEAWYNWLLARAQAATLSAEKDQLLDAIAEAQNETLAMRSLDLALTDSLPRTLRPGFIANIGATHPDLTWRFVREHRAEVDALLDPLQRLEFGPALVSGSADADRIMELTDFASTYPAEARRPVEAAAAEIAVNASVRQERVPTIDAYVESAMAPPEQPPAQPPQRRRRPPSS